MIETEKIINQFLKDQNYTREEYETEKKVLNRNIITCPICGKLTMDDYFVCKECHWEDGYYLDEADKVRFKENYESKKSNRH